VASLRSGYTRVWGSCTKDRNGYLGLKRKYYKSLRVRTLEMGFVSVDLGHFHNDKL
jgi:hypothetical protein